MSQRFPATAGGPSIPSGTQPRYQQQPGGGMRPYSGPGPNYQVF